MKQFIKLLASILTISIITTGCSFNIKDISNIENITTTEPISDTLIDPEPFIPNARYFKLPDDSIYTAPNNGDLFMLGFALIRENTINSNYKKLSAGNTWNGLQVNYAQSAWEFAGTSYNTASSDVHHQTINFIGEKTYIGETKIIYDASGEFPVYTVMYLNDSDNSQLPNLSTKNEPQSIFFNLYNDNYLDMYNEVTDLLLSGNTVIVSITTDNFDLELSNYGLSIDENTFGRFNNILNFEIINSENNYKYSV